ncbi:MAG: DUF4160 domain-containing protein [Candidatus Atribacteria bacterium]|nr:DUF4160 domain-containing protein [Candidatus Atribacteria bacterium]
MPTVFKNGPYRFFFHSNDRDEPIHVYVEREDMIAKFWLDPVRLQISGGFSRIELRRIQNIIEKNHQRLVEAWNDYFSN